jgi:hypothetical protein
MCDIMLVVPAKCASSNEESEMSVAGNHPRDPKFATKT